MAGRIEAKLARFIYEWNRIRASEFQETAIPAYEALLAKQGDFIETVLGVAERQRFESDGDAQPLSYNQRADLRIAALERLRDSPDRWRIQVDKAWFDPDGGAPDGNTTAEQPTPRRETNNAADDSSDLRSALEVERREGYKMLNALRGGPITTWRYGRIPRGADIDGWQGNIEHLLRDDPKSLHLFTWQPLGSGPRLSAIGAAAVSPNGPKIQRMERLLGQLEKVIERV